MSRRCTFVMYHYVRDLSRRRFPDIKGRLVSEFVEQLRYMERFYEFVTVEELKAAIRCEKSLPSNAAILTFDDGYADHFENIFPILDKRDIQGCFFPPARSILENRVLDVNKIHFILAAGHIENILEDLFDLLDAFRTEFDLLSGEAYWEDLASPNRFDPKEVIFIKRLLQRELPREAREKIVGELFSRYIETDEPSFARELYMTPEQIRCMARHGMHIGSHSYEHKWLDSLPIDEQRHQIDASLDFLAQLDVDTDNWIMCYPYGAYDKSLIEVLKNRDCLFGLTSDVGIAEVSTKNRLKLPRLDTNDLPVEASAKPNEWTRQVV